MSVCVCVCVSTKIEKEKRELAKQYGMVRTEVSGGEIAEDLEKERRMFQLHMCEVRGNASKHAACYMLHATTDLLIDLFFIRFLGSYD